MEDSVHVSSSHPDITLGVFLWTMHTCSSRRSPCGCSARAQSSDSCEPMWREDPLAVAGQALHCQGQEPGAPQDSVGLLLLKCRRQIPVGPKKATDEKARAKSLTREPSANLHGYVVASGAQGVDTGKNGHVLRRGRGPFLACSTALAIQRP